MNGKLALKCTDFRPVCRGSLRGFASVRVVEMRMTLSDIAVHVHEASGRAWASPPARPWIDKDGQVVRDDRGKIQYAPIVEFDGKQVRDAFGDAVIKAVLAFDADALQCREEIA
jgi:hypothetical protein